jgi:hypothetical protein
VIVSRQFQQSRVKTNRIAQAVQHGGLEIVVKHHTWTPAPVVEGMDVSPQKVFQRLIEEELQVKRSGPGQRHHETGQAPARSADGHFTKVRPVDLAFLAGKALQAEKGFTGFRPQTGDEPPDLHDAAGVAASLQHLKDPSRAELRMLVECFPDEVHKRLGLVARMMRARLNRSVSTAVRTVS